MEDKERKTNARLEALKILHRIDEDSAFSNILLNNLFKNENIKPRDKAFIAELVYGSVKAKKRLDWVIEQFTGRNVGDIAPWIRNILRLGVYQILYLERVPESATCNESVKLAKMFGHKGTVGFVNAVLRNIVRKKKQIKYPSVEEDPVEFISILYSHPDWLVKKWIDAFGVRNTISLCDFNNKTPPIVIRTNTLKINRKELKTRLCYEGVETVESDLVPEALILQTGTDLQKLNSFQEGLFQVQDISSMLVAHALTPEPGQFVIDSCAAPGGKSTHISQLMSDTGRIIAGELHPRKANLINENARRLEINNIEIIRGDVREWIGEYWGQAARVLVDAPCSGTGVLNRKADARWNKDIKMFEDLPQLQLSILEESAKALQKGGILVYSTCSLEREENMEVVESFLKRNNNFQLLRGTISTLAGYEIVNELENEGTMQLLPFKHGIDGFFIARLIKSM